MAVSPPGWINILVGTLLVGCSLLVPVTAQYDGYGDEDYPYGGYDDMDGGAGSGPPAPALSEHIAGVADLDPATFDKVVFAAARPTFVAFYDSADDSQKMVTAKWALDHAADKLANHVRLLMAKVEVGQKGGAALRSRFGVTETPSLVYIEGLDQNTAYQLDYDDSAPGEKLAAWLSEQAGSAASLPALMPVLQQFLSSSSEREAALARAQEIVPALPPFEARVGVYYLKIMKNVIKKGDGYLQTESKRLGHMLEDTSSSISPAKEAEFRGRKDVVDLFLAQ